MATFAAVVTVTLKPEILDPAGEATASVLRHLGYPIDSVRMGRHIQLAIEADSRPAAMAMAERAARDLLANPVMETFVVKVEP